ncbi:uncharacterized protein LOC125369290 [Ricinus communis]|uniref:uncharacterized protein LOC125369290 n=1 Tax=Ricinus communis TaxID=3988 RepID=UPI00201AC09E|nr:uncharacterized protein LOC125369290 [Ricinus communis]
MVNQLDSTVALVAQVELLTKKLDQLQMPQNNPYSSIYNPRWRNHPNFSWCNNNAQGPPGFGSRIGHHSDKLGPSELPPPAEKKSNLEELMMKFVTSIETRFQQTDSALRNHQASIQNLENHIGQISKMFSERQQGALPSTTESNLREHVNAITLHSGKLVSAPSEPVFYDSTINVQIEASSKVKEPKRRKVKPIPAREYQPKIPYPARLKQVKAQEPFSKLLHIFRQLHINLPFFDALKKMPKYSKFLKDILSNKSKLEEVAYVKLNEECSAVFQRNVTTQGVLLFLALWVTCGLMMH